MKTVAHGRRVPFDQSGSTSDSFLEEEGIRDYAGALALKRVLAWQLEQEMHTLQITKHAMAQRLHTSRSQLDRLPDRKDVSVPLDTMSPAAKAVGKTLVIRIADANIASVERRTMDVWTL